MKPTLSTGIFALAAVAVIAIGFFAGRLLKPDPTPDYAFDLSAPAYEATLPEPGLSKGGFTGFGETNGLPGSTLLSGKVASITPTEIVIEAKDGTKSTIRITNPISVSRIEAANRDALKSGATVVLFPAKDSDEIASLLVVASP
jgi:hypothetical protein